MSGLADRVVQGLEKVLTNENTLYQLGGIKMAMTLKDFLDDTGIIEIPDEVRLKDEVFLTENPQFRYVAPYGEGQHMYYSQEFILASDENRDQVTELLRSLREAVSSTDEKKLSAVLKSIEDLETTDIGITVAEGK